MGLFDLFATDVQCPRCGDPAARQALWGSVRCPNRQCEYFSQAVVDYHDATRAAQLRKAIETGDAGEPRSPHAGQRVAKVRTTPAAGFDPGVYRIDVGYENHAGDRKVFTGDRRTLRRRGRHVSLRVMPTGIRIALALDRIENRADVDEALRQLPTPQETRVLNYHARHGTTSARYEQLRQKYPDWSLHSP